MSQASCAAPTSGLSARHVIERDEVDALVIERVIAVAEVLPVQNAAVERGVVFARDRVDGARLESARDRLEQLHALRVRVAIVGVVSQIAGKEYEIRLLR